MAADAVIGLITAPVDRADEIARAVVERRLAACVNVVPAVRSHYWWDGVLQSEEEALLVVKTTRPAVGSLETLLREVHPYETFELVVLPVEGGSAKYLDWIGQEVRPE